MTRLIAAQLAHLFDRDSEKAPTEGEKARLTQISEHWAREAKAERMNTAVRMPLVEDEIDEVKVPQDAA